MAAKKKAAKKEIVAYTSPDEMFKDMQKQFDASLSGVLTEVAEMKKDAKDCLTALRFQMKRVEEVFVRFLKETTDKIHSHDVMLEKVHSTNENVEESLCNVLLAIRQNEYLQAWHPAQHGFPDLKVVGKHPIKLQGENGPQ